MSKYPEVSRFLEEYGEKRAVATPDSTLHAYTLAELVTACGLLGNHLFGKRSAFASVDGVYQRVTHATQYLAGLSCADAKQEMLDALERNAHKGSWKEDTLLALYGRLLEEVAELAGVLYSDPTGIDAGGAAVRQLRREAADVLNFAMMLADVGGHLPR